MRTQAKAHGDQATRGGNPGPSSGASGRLSCAAHCGARPAGARKGWRIKAKAHGHQAARGGDPGLGTWTSGGKSGGSRPRRWGIKPGERCRALRCSAGWCPQGLEDQSPSTWASGGKGEDPSQGTWTSGNKGRGSRPKRWGVRPAERCSALRCAAGWCPQGVEDQSQGTWASGGKGEVSRPRHMSTMRQQQGIKAQAVGHQAG